MFATKPVLPNFLKTLTIALFAFSGASTFAGQDKAQEEAIGEYNELKVEAMEAEEMVNELTDAEAEATGELEGMDDATTEVNDAAEQLKSEAKSLAEE